MQSSLDLDPDASRFQSGRSFEIDKEKFSLDYDSHSYRSSLLIHADCMEWLGRCPENSIHSIVTDPPYGVKEYDFDQIKKRENGNGGIWRLPPAFDGGKRSPLPRFTALNGKERDHLERFFFEWTRLVNKVLVPGAHVFIASNTFLSQLIFDAVIAGGLEYRGNIVRLVTTFRGGDRPKNYEKEFSEVCSLPRGNFEPWGLFRKPLPEKMTVGECLREFNTGALRRLSKDKPFADVISSERTPEREKKISNHPSLKPQSFLRQIVRASLPLGEGIVLDPFMGSGSTISAAEAIGYSAIGTERFQDYFEASKTSVEKLRTLDAKSS
ncbi:DNA-methyltransferase [Chromohalobacter marismortui]|nr:DNA methyltransferase [Chromohalobacter marismortui]